MGRGGKEEELVGKGTTWALQAGIKMWFLL